MHAMLWSFNSSMEGRDKLVGNNGDCAWWFWVGDLLEQCVCP